MLETIAIAGLFISCTIMDNLITGIIGYKIKENNLKLLKNYSKFKLNQSKEFDCTTTDISAIKPLVSIIQTHFNDKILTNLYNNLNTLNINNKIGRSATYGGEYFIDSNDIYLYNKNNFFASHEFMHMASNDEFSNCSGLGLSIHNSSFFSGFDEGYTELLNIRYFKSNLKLYRQAVRITKKIESLFDNYHDMEKFYFTADIDGLIDYLSKYMSRNKVIELLVDIDYIFYLNEHNNLFSYIKEYQVKNKIRKLKRT